MKKLLTILCLVLLSSYSYSQEVSRDQLVEREGVYYKKFSTTPFTGTSVDFYENGQLRMTGNYKNGKQEGSFKSYYEKGQPWEKGNSREGQLHGLYESYHENSIVEKYGNFIDGKQDGFWGYYYFNGQFSGTGKYKNGLEIGVWEYFDENGQSIYKGSWNHNEEFSEFFDEKGTLRIKGKLIIGTSHGPFEFYHENGQFWKKGNYIEGKEDGIFVFLDKNKKVEYLKYFIDGKNISKKQYFNKRPDEKGQLVSKESFYENSQLEHRKNYENGKLDGVSEEFHENGQLEWKGTYKDGKQEGLWEGYDEKGRLKEIGKYNNNKRDGMFHLYNYNWGMEVVVYYIDGKDTRRRQYFKKRPNEKKSWDEFCRGYLDGGLMIGTFFCPDQPRKLSTDISDYDQGFSLGSEDLQDQTIYNVLKEFKE